MSSTGTAPTDIEPIDVDSYVAGSWQVVVVKAEPIEVETYEPTRRMVEPVKLKKEDLETVDFEVIGTEPSNSHEGAPAVKQEPARNTPEVVMPAPDALSQSLTLTIQPSIEHDDFQQNLAAALGSHRTNNNHEEYSHGQPTDLSVSDELVGIAIAIRDIQDVIRAGKAKQDEYAQVSQLQERQAHLERLRRKDEEWSSAQTQQQVDSLFFNDEDDDEDNMMGSSRHAVLSGVGNSASMRDSVAPNADLDQSPQPKPARGRQHARASRITKPRGGRRGGLPAPSTLNYGSLMHNSLVNDVQSNRGLGVVPAHRSTNKRAALDKLLASIPSSEQSHRKTGKALDDACKTFRRKGPGTMHADGEKGWRMKGMRTSLEHFQLLGASWMVKRETGATGPWGGMQSDTMGLGKTIQTICVLMENRPKPRCRWKSTLVVCASPTLCDQWVAELRKHCDPQEFGQILVHKRGNRISSADVVDTMQQASVIITTFAEVLSNHPRNDPPKNLTTEAAKQQWWDTYYDENKGPLLRARFYRVVLDEAQIIKNHLARTSVACRKLNSKYRWVLTGTPLSNNMEELFPYFDFLRVEGAGSFQLFKENYCKRNDTTHRRLAIMLQKVMLRRTYADRVFTLPIVDMPNLDHVTEYLEFSSEEGTIYQIVRERYAAKINEWSMNGALSKHNILVLLLRLRQLCAHSLFFTSVTHDLLTNEDMKKLWDLARQGGSKSRVLSQVLSQAEHRRRLADSQQETYIESRIAKEYRQTMENLYAQERYEALIDKRMCSRCQDIPSVPKLTDPCGHLFCEECLSSIRFEAQHNNLSPSCAACYTRIQRDSDFRFPSELRLQEPGEEQLSPQARKLLSANLSEDDSWLDIPGSYIFSAKLRSVREFVRQWLADRPDAKIVIFSLWITMINAIDNMCKADRWGSLKFTGKMTNEQKDHALRQWRDEKSKKQIFIISMKAGGIGLNLIEANYCLLVDSWFNDAQQDQAMSRIYRIGQKRDCVVRKLMIKNTVDTEYLLEMQRRKTKEISSVIESQPEKWDNEELMRLFGQVKYDQRTGQPIIDGEDTDQFELAADAVIDDDSDAEGPSAGC